MTARGGSKAFWLLEQGRSMLPAPAAGTRLRRCQQGRSLRAASWRGHGIRESREEENVQANVQANGAAGLAGAHSASRMARRQLPRCRRKGFAPRSRGFRQGMLHAEHDALQQCAERP